MSKLEDRLKTLEKLNANPNFVNKDLYRMLYREDFYIIAYERLKSNRGAMTAGVAPKDTVDGMSIKKIKKLIGEIRSNSYQPKPVRRVMIPKANGKERPLGIPCFRDKLVQECIKILLTCIYEGDDNATFSKFSFGFRPNLGCHAALKTIKNGFNGSHWIIKADVKGFFDNVDHSILIKCLEKRIDDKRFIQLIWKFLRCGVMTDKQVVKTKKGTPQGGNLSPILANIYLHEFDMFMEDMMQNFGTSMVNNKIKNRESARLTILKKKLEESDRLTDELYAWKKSAVDKQAELVRNIPSRVLGDSNKMVIRYVRYADDWIIGLKGGIDGAKFVFDKCKDYFEQQLNLEWNMSKSELIRSTDKPSEFLGVYLNFTTKRQIKKIRKAVKGGKKFLWTSVPENYLRLSMDDKDVFKKLAPKGFVDKNFQPISCKRLVNLDVMEIARIYKSTMNGIYNYYCFVHNPQALNKIHYYLFISLCKTLAHKFKSRKAQIMKKYFAKGTTVLHFKPKAGNMKTITFAMYGGYLRDVSNFKVRVITDDTVPIEVIKNTRTSSWLLLKECCVCEKTKEIEMHHVNAIRKLGKSVKGFTRVLRMLNRKQIPVCRTCHMDIEYGKYDGPSVRKKLFKQIAKKLGIRKWEDRELTPQAQALMKK